MKQNYTFVVLKKELTDIFRDRKTVFSSLILPVVLYIVMFSLMGNGVSDMMGGGDKNTVVALSGEAARADVRTFLETHVFEDTPGISLTVSKDPLAAMDSEAVTLVLSMDAEAAANLLDGAPAKVDIVYHDQKNASTAAVEYLQSVLNRYNDESMRAALWSMGIDPNALFPLSMEITAYTAATGNGAESGGGHMILAMLLPMLMSVFLVVGGMATAVDLFAGEKERHTLEPLLCTRAGRGSILTGKYLAVTIFSLISTAVMALGLYGGMLVNPNLFSFGMDTGGGLSLDAAALALSILLLFLMSATYAGLHVALSTYARNIKEASTYGSFLMIVGMLPTFATMYSQAGDIKMWMMACPVLNVVGALKMLLGGILRYDMLLVAIGVSVVFLLLVLGLTRWMFRKERFLFRV